MARRLSASIPAPVSEPESRAYAIVPTSQGTLLRTYALRGDQVLAYDDSEPDTKAAAITQLLRILTRD